MEEQIILIDKPAGVSSFYVVAKVRGYLKAQFGHKIKVGHTGTLDPFATGLLILLSGSYTKKSGEFLKLDKVYTATIKLGYVSSTGDSEGEIRPYLPEEQAQLYSSSDPSLYAHRYETQSLRSLSPSQKNLQRSRIEAVLHDFTGEIEQIPPKFSAIKIDGKRAYELARKGVDFEVPSRKVKIYKLEILEYEYPILKLRCFVSSGTYIRTLAEDIGMALGTGAYCEELRRLKVGEYDVRDARPLEDFLDKKTPTKSQGSDCCNIS